MFSINHLLWFFNTLSDLDSFSFRVIAGMVRNISGIVISFVPSWLNQSAPVLIYERLLIGLEYKPPCTIASLCKSLQMQATLLLSVQVGLLLGMMRCFKFPHHRNPSRLIPTTKAHSTRCHSKETERTAERSPWCPHSALWEKSQR